VSTTAAPPEVAGRHFDRAEQGVTEPWTDRATLVLLSGLIIGAVRTVVTAVRQP
jgi:hypothetical protein